MLHKAFLFLLVAQIAAGAVLLVVQLAVDLPYGRQRRRAKAAVLDGRAAWVMMEAPAALAMGLMYAVSGRRALDSAVAFLLLWEAHYAYRVLIYPLLVRPAGRGFPVALVPVVALLNAAHGFANGYYLFMLPFTYGPAAFASAFFVAGVMLFVLGAALHIRSDLILRDLAEQGGYGVPDGRPFRLVSSPNYLGALVQWIGWALLARSLPAYASAWVVACSLLPRALAHHRWYRRHHPGYRSERRALLPWLL